jgi:EAL and modified HD-GYP domain-containing signal transduction protein
VDAPTPTDGVATLRRFLTRQPILNGEHRIVGYELRRRDPATDAMPGAGTPRQAEDELLLASAIDLAFKGALGEKLTVLAVATETLHSPLLEQLPKDRVVVAIHPDRASPPALIARAERLAHDGLQLALDDPAEHRDLVAYCRYIRLDTTRHDAMSLADEIVRCLDTGRGSKPRLIATQVDTPEVHAACRKLSFSLFQGYYYTCPVAAAHRLDSNGVRVMELLNLARNRAEYQRLEKVFKLDPALSYRLLRYVNSPAIGLRQNIESIGQALILLGYDQIYRWLTLLLFTADQAEPRSQSLLRNALVRARFSESLGRVRLNSRECEGLFIVGIFSMLDALFNLPMEQALAGLQLPRPVVDALVERRGLYAPYLRLAIACERFDQATIAGNAAEIGLDADVVNLAHVNALIWSEGIEI